jgi:hypothetical protein
VLLFKNLFLKFGGFDPLLKVCEDYDLWLKISRFFPIGLCRHEGLIRYAGHGDQLSDTECLDFFRLKTLAFLYEKEKNEAFKFFILEVLEKKFKIYQKGAEKRGIKISRNDFGYTFPICE